MLLNNTKNLATSIVIPQRIKTVAKLLQFISLKLTLKFVDKLFKTPIDFKTPEREKMMWDSAQKQRLKIDNIHKEIEVLSYGYSSKKVLLIHGWSGRSTQLFMIADKLLEKGYMIISFDGPAHGKSEGKHTNLLDFIDTVTQINKDFGPFHSAVGHSFGGTVLYNTAKLLNLNSFVTIASANKISTTLYRFSNSLGLKPKIGFKLKNYYEKKFQKKLDEFASFQKAKNIKTPVLVVHDSLDGDVPVSCAKNIRQNLKNGSLLITQGLGHTKILRDKETMNRVVNFIHKNQ